MTGAEGGEWTRNPRQLDRAFQERFLTPFRAELAGMLDAQEASSRRSWRACRRSSPAPARPGSKSRDRGGS